MVHKVGSLFFMKNLFLILIMYMFLYVYVNMGSDA